MDKKPFIIILIIVIITFVFVYLVKNYQPASNLDVNLADFPLEIDGWIGEKEDIPDYVFTQLNPVDIFSADYFNRNGIQVNLFVDYFESNNVGGPHSPRNCLPGSGWVILESTDRNIKFGNRTISASRMNLRLGDVSKIMDFWYLTKYGETSNDYMFKFYAMLSSLTFNPTDVAFIRIITNSDSASVSALDDFEQSVLEEIYNRLPFE